MNPGHLGPGAILKRNNCPSKVFPRKKGVEPGLAGRRNRQRCRHGLHDGERRDLPLLIDYPHTQVAARCSDDVNADIDAGVGDGRTESKRCRCNENENNSGDNNTR